MTEQTQASATETAAKPTKKETVITTVTMTDGRIVDFAGNRRMLKSSEIEGKNVYLRIDFINGQTRRFQIPKELFLQFVAHGAEQKYGDATAGIKEVDDMVLAVDTIDAQIQRGEFNVKRETGEGSGSSVLLRALMEAMPNVPREKLVENLSKLSHKKKLALRSSEKLSPIVARLEAEKAQKSKEKVDTDALFAGFEAAAA